MVPGAPSPERESSARSPDKRSEVWHPETSLMTRRIGTRKSRNNRRFWIPWQARKMNVPFGRPAVEVVRNEDWRGVKSSHRVSPNREFRGKARSKSFFKRRRHHLQALWRRSWLQFNLSSPPKQLERRWSNWRRMKVWLLSPSLQTLLRGKSPEVGRRAGRGEGGTRRTPLSECEWVRKPGERAVIGLRSRAVSGKSVHVLGRFSERCKPGPRHLVGSEAAIGPMVRPGNRMTTWESWQEFSKMPATLKTDVGPLRSIPRRWLRPDWMKTRRRSCGGRVLELTQEGGTAIGATPENPGHWCWPARRNVWSIWDRWASGWRTGEPWQRPGAPIAEDATRRERAMAATFSPGASWNVAFS